MPPGPNPWHHLEFFPWADAGILARRERGRDCGLPWQHFMSSYSSYCVASSPDDSGWFVLHSPGSLQGFRWIGLRVRWISKLHLFVIFNTGKDISKLVSSLLQLAIFWIIDFSFGHLFEKNNPNFIKIKILLWSWQPLKMKRGTVRWRRTISCQNNIWWF